MKVAIIGAGIAGVSCADGLRAAGHSVTLFDKGRGAGGRMSTRRLRTALGEVAIDHGAQYFTARDPAFRELVATWADQGIAEPWALAGADAWVGVPGMNAVVRQMARAHHVEWNHLVKGLARRADSWWLIGEGGETGPFDAVILAIPAEQAAVILSLHDLAMTRLALGARSQPCWAGMFVFGEPLDGLPHMIRSGGDVAWAARNSAKPGRSGPEAWIVQGSAAWSRTRLEHSRQVIADWLLAELAHLAGSVLPPPIEAQAHLWRYALSAGTGDGALWNAGLGLGVCGDWLLGPRIECAWLSGRLLAQRCVGAEPAAGPPTVSEPEAPLIIEHPRFVVADTRVNAPD